jgi:hypothetical protein
MAVDRVRVRFPGGVIPRRKDAGSGQTDSPLSNLCRNMFYEAVFLNVLSAGPGRRSLRDQLWTLVSMKTRKTTNYNRIFPVGRRPTPVHYLRRDGIVQKPCGCGAISIIMKKKKKPATITFVAIKKPLCPLHSKNVRSSYAFLFRI